MDYGCKRTQAVLGMNNTHVRKLACECIATGRRSVIRRKKTRRDQRPWRWNRFGGFIPCCCCCCCFQQWLYYLHSGSATFVLSSRSDVIQYFCVLISDKTVSRGRESDCNVGIEVRARTVLKILPWLTTKRSRSRWSCCLRRGSAAARFLGWWVRIPPVAWTSVYCDWCVLCR